MYHVSNYSTTETTEMHGFLQNLKKRKHSQSLWSQRLPSPYFGQFRYLDKLILIFLSKYTIHIYSKLIPIAERTRRSFASTCAINGCRPSTPRRSSACMSGRPTSAYRSSTPTRLSSRVYTRICL